jgi:hypothetical protein
MSSINGLPGGQTGTDDKLLRRQVASYFRRVKLRALMDVGFGVAVLSLLLVWLVLTIAGGRLT